MMGRFPEIKTKRLLLREIKKEDASDIYKILSDPEVVKLDTFEVFEDVQQVERLIERFHEMYNSGQAIFWGISLVGRDEIIGFCKCEIEIPRVRADIGYDLRRDYWNMGIMTEALNGVVKFAFESLEIRRIEASVSTENTSSIRVLEKIGFSQEGVLRQRGYWKGKAHDMAILSRLKDEGEII